MSNHIGGSNPSFCAIGGLGEWFKPAVLKTADRMLNAVRPFESDILLALIDLRCCFDVGRSAKKMMAGRPLVYLDMSNCLKYKYKDGNLCICVISDFMPSY